MQTIIYHVPLPHIGDKVTISDINNEYMVNSLESDTPPYDSAIIINTKTNELSRIIVSRGQWQVENYTLPHKVQITQPIMTQPFITQPMMTQPMMTQPMMTQPMMTQPMMTQPMMTQPMMTQPMMTQPMMTQPMMTQPMMTQPMMTQPMMTQHQGLSQYVGQSFSDVDDNTYVLVEILQPDWVIKVVKYDFANGEPNIEQLKHQRSIIYKRSQGKSRYEQAELNKKTGKYIFVKNILDDTPYIIRPTYIL